VFLTIRVSNIVSKIHARKNACKVLLATIRSTAELKKLSLEHGVLADSLVGVTCTN